MRYSKGQPVTVSTTVTNNLVTPPVLVDAGTLKLTVKKPDATTQDYTTPSHDGVGLYHQVIPTADLTQIGPYVYWWTATGAGAGVSEPESFDVADPAAQTLITLGEAKAQLQIKDTSKDALLLDYVAGITAAVEEYKHEVIVPRAVTDEIEVSAYSGSFGWRQKFRVWSAPVISLTTVVSWDGLTTWNAADMRVSPSGVVRVMNGPWVCGLVDVTYQAGYASIPERYKQGALIILQHVWETQRGVGNVRAAVTGPEDVYDRRLEFTIPQRAKEWLGPARPLVA
jgi:hypothetical protein